MYVYIYIYICRADGPISTISSISIIGRTISPLITISIRIVSIRIIFMCMTMQVIVMMMVMIIITIHIIISSSIIMTVIISIIIIIIITIITGAALEGGRARKAPGSTHLAKKWTAVFTSTV